MTPRHSLRTRLGLVLASLLVSLGAAEVVARLAYTPVLDLEGLVPWQKQAFTPPINEQGFREGPPGAVPPDSFRVLMLGDSFTFGHGLYDGSQRFSDLVEARYNAEAGGPGVHVYNAGIPGSNPMHWAHFMDLVLPGYDARCVFAVFFLRDGTSMGTSLRFHRDKIDAIKERHRSVAYDLSYLVRMLVDRAIVGEFSTWYEGEFHRAYLGNHEETAPWRRAREHLCRIRDECERRRIPFHLVIFPMLLDLDRYGFDDVEREIARFAAEAKIPCFSLTPGFLGRSAPDLWISASDQHPNAEGHRVAAEALYPYFRDAVGAAR